MGRFKHLVDSEEGMKKFKTKYSIPPNVDVRYAVQGEWFDERKTKEMVIPMIALIWVPSLGTSLNSLGFLPHSVPQTCLGC